MELSLKLMAVLAALTGAFLLILGIMTPQPGSDNVLVLNDAPWLISMGLFIGVAGPPVFLYNARVASRINRSASDDHA